MKHSKLGVAIIAVGAAVAVAACGGSGTDGTSAGGTLSTATANEDREAPMDAAPAAGGGTVARFQTTSGAVPASATASGEAFIAYLKSLSPTDGGRPLRIESRPPTDMDRSRPFQLDRNDGSS